MSSLANVRKSLVGAVDHCGTDYIGGWVTVEVGSFHSIDIDILYHGEAIGHCEVDSDSTGAGRFRFDLPLFFPRGELNEIEVWVRQASQRLYANVGLPPQRSNSARTFSRFGGTWVDRADWKEELAERRRAGRFSSEVANRFRGQRVSRAMLRRG